MVRKICMHHGILNTSYKNAIGEIKENYKTLVFRLRPGAKPLIDAFIVIKNLCIYCCKEVQDARIIFIHCL